MKIGHQFNILLWEAEIAAHPKRFNKTDDIIIRKMGLPPLAAEWCRSVSEKYALWLAARLVEARNIGAPIDSKFINAKSLYDLGDFGTGLKSYVTDLLNVVNRPPLDLKTLDLTAAREYRNQMGYLTDWAENPDVETPNMKVMTWAQAMAEANEWHNRLRAGGPIKDEKGTVMHKFADGSYWINTHKSYSAEESAAAGHCGRASREDMVLVSYRKNGNVFLTLDWHEPTGEIIQFKGAQNDKPLQKYHPYIKWFISDPARVKLLNTHKGHRPPTNFQLTDLTPQDLEEVLTANPALGNFMSCDIDNPDFQKILLSSPERIRASIDATIDSLQDLDFEQRTTVGFQAKLWKLPPPLAQEINDIVFQAIGERFSGNYIGSFEDMAVLYKKLERIQETVKNNREFNEINKGLHAIIYFSRGR